MGSSSMVVLIFYLRVCTGLFFLSIETNFTGRHALNIPRDQRRTFNVHYPFNQPKRNVSFQTSRAIDFVHVLDQRTSSFFLPLLFEWFT